MKLELCPCCQSTAELRNTLGKTFWVQCTNTKCGLQTRKYGCDNAAEIAMKRWNTRASNEFADGEWHLFDHGWQREVATAPAPKTYPTNCKNCGAVLHSHQCEYCGSEYYGSE